MEDDDEVAGAINGSKNKINHTFAQLDSEPIRYFDCDEGGDEGVDYDMVRMAQ